jgi:DNA-binding Xre family transcriptional regulator
MSFLTQLRELVAQRGTTPTRLADVVGIARPNLATTLAGKHDTRGSTLEAIAGALDAQWVLVPKEHLAAVQQVLEGRDAGPDRAAKAAVDLLLEKKT